MKVEDLVYGPSKTEFVVSCDYKKDDELEVFFEKDGLTTSRTYKVPHWLLCDQRMTNSIEFTGKSPLRFFKTFQSTYDMWAERREGGQYLNIYDDKERALILAGFTYFKGLEPKQVSTLSFDIEATGITHDDTSKVLIISNTFRDGLGRIERKLFAYDDYDNDAEMFNAWCAWVRRCNPSIIVGHNIFSYDLPYLDFCARRAGTELVLGRDDSPLRFNKWESKFRRDGSQFYPYYAANIYGRNIIDTFFLSIRYDVGRKYASYGLKPIIEYEGLQVANRQFYDASQIRFKYKDKAEWALILKYAEHDADDALALYDLMIPAYFYLARSVPKSFQALMQGAPGGQINSLIVRAYIQHQHSIPLPDEAVKYEGAISSSSPGIYKNCQKFDCQSMYPSIMIEHKTFDENKEPLKIMPSVLDYLTKERLENKRLAKETGLRRYKDLESSAKVTINSFYGAMGTAGINFNMPKCAAEVTRIGRDIIIKATEWSEKKGFTVCNRDTDAILFTNNSQPFTEDDKNVWLNELNSLFPQRIIFTDDGFFESVVVIATKNYSLKRGTKHKIKGSALLGSTKEKKFSEFIQKVLEVLHDD